MYWNKGKTILLFLLAFQIVKAGIFTPSKAHQDLAKPFFKYSLYSYPQISRDSIQIKIQFDVPYNELQFVRYEEKFRAIYEGTVVVINDDDEQCFSKIWLDTIIVDKYEETNLLKSFAINEIVFNIEPNEYSIKYGIRDMDSKKKQYFTKEYDYDKYYNKSVIISEMKLKEQEQTEEKSVPTEADILADSSDAKSRVYELEYEVLSEGGVGEIIYSIKDLDDKVIYTKSYERVFSGGVSDLKFVFDARNLQYKEYILEVEIQLGKDKVKQQKKFQIRWSGMNFYIRNLAQAIEQLVYITDGKTLKKIRNAKGEEQKELFLEFWKSKDPTPGTVKNELMNEYYSRMQYAEAHFRGHRDGWRSDMGMIFVLFGVPDNVERHPFEINSKPYEIWYYNEKNKVFYFIDDTGFGDYRLLNTNQIYY